MCWEEWNYPIADKEYVKNMMVSCMTPLGGCMSQTRKASICELSPSNMTSLLPDTQVTRKPKDWLNATTIGLGCPQMFAIISHSMISAHTSKEATWNQLDLAIPMSWGQLCGWLSPFTILELVGNTVVKLHLPHSMYIHPVVNVSCIKPYQEQLKGQHVTAPGPSNSWRIAMKNMMLTMSWIPTRKDSGWNTLYTGKAGWIWTRPGNHCLILATPLMQCTISMLPTWLLLTISTIFPTSISCNSSVTLAPPCLLLHLCCLITQKLILMRGVMLHMVLFLLFLFLPLFFSLTFIVYVHHSSQAVP